MENRIHIHPDICNGRPVISGTRILVQTIMEFLGAGDSIDEILEEYPSLQREDIYACIQIEGPIRCQTLSENQIGGPIRCQTLSAAKPVYASINPSHSSNERSPKHSQVSSRIDPTDI